MILLIARDSYGLGNCYKPCFGPVTKVQVYNDKSQGYLYVDGNNVKSDHVNMAIYRITSGVDFYLYDAHAEKFICWNRRWRDLRNPKKTLVARKFRRGHKAMRHCKFIDKPTINAYVKLVPSFNKTLKMMFKGNGTPTNKLSNDARRERFVMTVVEAKDDRLPGYPCGCPEAEQYFCETPLRKMKEFHDICRI